MINEAKILYQINSINESNVISLWFVSAYEFKHRIKIMLSWWLMKQRFEIK